MARCTLCFQDRPVQPPIPGAPVTCKGCAFVITRTVGWFEANGVEMQLIMAKTGELLSLPQHVLPAPTNNGDNPPTPRTKRERPRTGKEPPVDVSEEAQVGEGTPVGL